MRHSLLPAAVMFTVLWSCSVHSLESLLFAFLLRKKANSKSGDVLFTSGSCWSRCHGNINYNSNLSSLTIFTITANPMFLLPWVYDICGNITTIIHLQSKKQEVKAALTALRRYFQIPGWQERGLGCTSFTLATCQLRCWLPEYTAAWLWRKSILSADVIVKALSTSRPWTPMSWRFWEIVWMFRLRVGMDAVAPTWFKIVTSSEDPPGVSTASASCTWKG